MGYSRPHIRQAVAAARDAGHEFDGFAGDRDTVLRLERLGFLPVDQDEVDRRVQDWYVANGLAVRDGDTPDTPDTPAPNTPDTSSDRSRVALEAAEAALVAATAAIRLARLTA
jgi:hypothetical protein